MTKALYKNQAIILHSGGQDSTTCLAWAMKEFEKVELISFDYGQRHKRELEAAQKIAQKLELSHKTIELPLLSELTSNALTDNSIKVKAGNEDELPSTFVDGRNMVFLTAAAIHAKQKGIPNLVTGVCQTDYSGYPDCREEFIRSIEKTLNLAMEFPFKIHTPLMFLTKAETVEMMQKLGILELLKYTHTCYEGRELACGKCPACKLRLKGFEEAGLKDPLNMNSKLYKEGSDYNQKDLNKIRQDLKQAAPLETFSFSELSPGEHWVTISSPEFTAICPFSDYPDFGSVTINYVPNKKCLELKSFKLYINAFRSVKIFHEAVTEVIFADFLEVVKPKKAHIVVDMNVRGNVKTICEKKYEV